MIRAAPVDERSATLKTAIAMADAEGVEAVTLPSTAARAGLALTAVKREFEVAIALSP